MIYCTGYLPDRTITRHRRLAELKSARVHISVVCNGCRLVRFFEYPADAIQHMSVQGVAI